MSAGQKIKPSPLSIFAIESLRQMFLTSPIWDGDLVSKQGRAELINMGYATRMGGYNYLTMEGVTLCITSDLDREKERR